jgi:hypothetical protein
MVVDWHAVAGEGDGVMSIHRDPCDPGAGAPQTAGILFGPTNSGKFYLSTYRHRGSGSRIHKSKWKIAPALECCIFRSADDADWNCSRGHYWGVHDGGTTELGEQGERLCKFPCTSNNHDPWHGYPVLSQDDAPPDDLVETWIAQGVISKVIGRKIQKGRI